MFRRLLLLAATALSTSAVAAPVDDTVAKAIATMTLEEKAAQLQSTAPANPKVGIPAFDWWNEGLHGLARNGYATVFPQAVGLAATWDAELLGKVGDVVATEARAKFNTKPADADRRIFEGLTIWSPNINIFRDPRWGRGQETYGEDPHLTGTLGVAFVKGLQGPDPSQPKVIATPKHLAVHSGPEAGRDSFSVDVSPQDLESTYLPAFRKTITEGQAQSVMCAYNAIHGVPVCALPSLMVDRVRKDWGFKGFTVSDCDAVANVHMFHHYRLDAAGAAAASLKGGTDLNCGNTYAALPEAVKRGLVTEAEIDTSLARALEGRRVLGTAFGASSKWASIKPDQVNTPEHRALALEAARKAIVLLKNDNAILPLKPGTRIAVIGPNADDIGALEGNYKGVAKDPVTPLEGIRRQFGLSHAGSAAASISMTDAGEAPLGTPHVHYAQGAMLVDGAAVVMPETAFSHDGQPGLKGEYFATSTVTGSPVATRRDRRVDFNLARVAPLDQLDPKSFAARWTGQFVPPGPGRYVLAIDIPACWKDCTRHDEVRLWIDGKPLHQGLLGKQRVEIPYTSDGKPVDFRLELDHYGEDEGLRMMWQAPAEALLQQALAATADADVIVATVGLTPDLEGEALQVTVPGFVGGDRTEIELPLAQRRLLQALRDTGKPVIVVLASGSAVTVDPALADAMLTAWYPGEEGGTAIAETLAGLNNPSGRLPVTIYQKTSDLPAFVDYGMKERTYRFFTGTPLYGFGHGLSYTSYAYDQIKAKPGTITASVEVSVRVSNKGKLAGEEVVQAYLVPPSTKGPRTLTTPVLQRQLVAFTRAPLKPGKATDVRFTIDPRSLSIVARDGTRTVQPGTYKLWIGGGQPGTAPGVWTEFTLQGEAWELPK